MQLAFHCLNFSIISNEMLTFYVFSHLNFLDNVFLFYMSSYFTNEFFLFLVICGRILSIKAGLIFSLYVPV